MEGLQAGDEIVVLARVIDGALASHGGSTHEESRSHDVPQVVAWATWQWSGSRLCIGLFHSNGRERLFELDFIS